MPQSHSPQMYRYQAFGLILHSEIEIPELAPSSEQKTDVTVKIAALSAELYGGANKENHFSAGHNYFYLQIKNVARFLIAEGSQITIAPLAGVKKEQIRLYLLGTSMGVVLHQRGILPLHGSGIATENGCALFLGESGVGKSTLVAALSRYGYLIVTDDICALTFRDTDKEIEVHPSYPQVKLCPNIIEYLKIPPATLTEISPGLNKFGVCVANNFQKTSMRLSKIFILCQHDNPGVIIEQLKGMQKFAAVANHLYRGTFMEQPHLTEQKFKHCAQLCKTMPSIFRVLRPENTFSLKHVMKLIIKHL